MLVDDDQDVHEIISMAPRAAGGYDLDICVSGEQALRRVRRAPPELILLDVMMPGQDGLETLRRLKARPATANVPVVMLTAAASEGDRKRWIRQGASDVVTKPFEPLALPAMLERIRRKAARRPPTVEAEAIAELRRRYASQLPAKTEAIARAVGALRSEDDAGKAFHLAHRLAGSAAIHQFHAVSRAAHAIQRRLKSLAGPPGRWPDAALLELQALGATLVRAADPERTRRRRNDRRPSRAQARGPGRKGEP